MLFFLESIFTYISYMLQEETLGHRLVFTTFSFKWNKKYLNWISCMTIWNQVCWFIGFITCLSGILVHEWWLKPFWCTAKVGIDGKKGKKKRVLAGCFYRFGSMTMSYLFPQVLLQFWTRGLVLTFLGCCNVESSLKWFNEGLPVGCLFCQSLNLQKVKWSKRQAGKRNPVQSKTVRR